GAGAPYVGRLAFRSGARHDLPERAPSQVPSTGCVGTLADRNGSAGVVVQRTGRRMPDTAASGSVACRFLGTLEASMADQARCGLAAQRLRSASRWRLVD